MLELQDIKLNDDGDMKQEIGDHTLYKMPKYKNGETLDSIKNQQKLNLLKSRCMNLDIYPVKMIKLLLDGDYKGELKNYKTYIVQFINEILEKKIPYTRLGVQTKLYKLICSVKKGGCVQVNKERSKKKEPEQETEEEEIKDIETLKKVIIEHVHRGEKEKGLYILDEYLEPYDPLYKQLLFILSSS